MVMFAEDIAFVCFYKAEQVLSAIVKFMFTSLEKGRDGMEWERKDMGKQTGERESMEGQKMGTHEN